MAYKSVKFILDSYIMRITSSIKLKLNKSRTAFAHEVSLSEINTSHPKYEGHLEPSRSQSSETEQHQTKNRGENGIELQNNIETIQMPNMVRYENAKIRLFYVCARLVNLKPYGN